MCRPDERRHTALLLSGRSVLAIDKNGINYENLKKMNMNVNDLIEAVRSSGYMDFAIINVITSSNGCISPSCRLPIRRTTISTKKNVIKDLINTTSIYR